MPDDIEREVRFQYGIVHKEREPWRLVELAISLAFWKLTEEMNIKRVTAYDAPITDETSEVVLSETVQVSASEDEINIKNASSAVRLCLQKCRDYDPDAQKGFNLSVRCGGESADGVHVNLRRVF